jgi:hypothetical protein
LKEGGEAKAAIRCNCRVMPPRRRMSGEQIVTVRSVSITLLRRDQHAASTTSSFRPSPIPIAHSPQPQLNGPKSTALINSFASFSLRLRAKKKLSCLLWRQSLGLDPVWPPGPLFYFLIQVQCKTLILPSSHLLGYL